MEGIEYIPSMTFLTHKAVNICGVSFIFTLRGFIVFEVEMIVECECVCVGGGGGRGSYNRAIL